jgi:hypothetical protein
VRSLLTSIDGHESVESAALSRLRALPGGTTFREITPDGYLACSFMLLNNASYSFLRTVAGSTWEARRAGM